MLHRNFSHSYGLKHSRLYIMVLSIVVRSRPYVNRYFSAADHLGQQITDMVMSAYDDQQPLPITYNGIWGNDADGDNIAQQVVNALNASVLCTSLHLIAAYSQTTDDILHRTYDVITVSSSLP